MAKCRHFMTKVVTNTVICSRVYGVLRKASPRREWCSHGFADMVCSRAFGSHFLVI